MISVFQTRRSVNSKTGCNANGCSGECLTASDVATPWNADDVSALFFQLIQGIRLVFLGNNYSSNFLPNYLQGIYIFAIFRELIVVFEISRDFFVRLLTRAFD